jgi:5-methyltetrahydrofolate--homocysteine methyltransferase
MTTAARTTLRDLIAARGCALFDGAMGTMLQGAGLEAGEAGERWNLDRPDAVAEIHRGYAAAGSMLVTTNTFGASGPRLAASELADRVGEVNAAAVRIARSVADEFGALVAGDVGPTGELIEPLGTLSAADAQAAFEEQIDALARAGADLILGETMSDLGEAEAVVRAAREAAPDLEVAVTLSFDTNRHTMMGVSPAQAVTTLSELGVTAVGANCGRGIADMEAVMAEMVAHRPEGVLLIAQSNAGLPVIRGDAFHYDTSPEEMAAYALRMRELGVELVGGCCGSTPAHMAAMATALNG